MEKILEKLGNFVRGKSGNPEFKWIYCTRCVSFPDSATGFPTIWVISSSGGVGKIGLIV